MGKGGEGGKRRATKDFGCLSFCFGLLWAPDDSLSDAFRGLNEAVWACGDAIYIALWSSATTELRCPDASCASRPGSRGVGDALVGAPGRFMSL